MDAERQIERLEAHLVHQNPWWEVFDDHVRFPSGREGRHLRLVLTTDQPGAVALVIREQAEERHVALVRQWRYAQGTSMWELPRGSSDLTDADAAVTATRELLEETGLQAAEVTFLGSLTTDSPLIEGLVGVYLITVEDAPPVETDGEIDAFEWVPWERFVEMIRTGDIRDGFTLSAFGLFTAFTSPQ